MEATPAPILTPDQRLRVYVCAASADPEERAAALRTVESLRLIPVSKASGARPHTEKELVRSYLLQSQIFVGILGADYQWGEPIEQLADVEEEYRLSEGLPRLLYVRDVPTRDPRLQAFLEDIQSGPHSLKFFKSTEELTRFIGDDLAVLLTESFSSAEKPQPMPEERALTIPKPTLPGHTTSLIGRDKDIEEVAEILRRDDVRLVTLTGPGGIGKSRLGFEVLEREANSFSDGIQFVLLAPLHDPNLVPGAIAQALTVREAPDRSPIEVVKELLRDRDMLLMLDNFEHVIGAAPVIADLLATAPRLKLLVTSRYALQLLGEREYAVKPLSVPTDPNMTKDHLAQYGAVGLFVDRATSANRSFELNEANAGAVVEIVAQLDGLPLAIELAAARARSLPPKHLLERLQSRLDLLTKGPRDLPERQQTLRALLDWDYDLLEPDERTLFRRLSVFARGFTFEAAQRVALPEHDELDVLELVESLLRKSLLRQAEVVHGEARFTMLNTLREYAGEKLEQAEEVDEVHRRHLDYFVEFAERASKRLRDPDQIHWLDALEADRDNMRVALRWSDREGDAEAALRLAGALALFWESRGYLTEGQRWLERALALGGPSAPPELRAACLDGAGILARSQGELKRSRALLEEGVDLRAQLGDRSGLANTLRNLGNVLFDIGDLVKTRELYEQSLATYREAGDDAGIAAVLNNLGVLASFQEEWSRAETLYEEAYAVYKRREDTQGIARSLMNLGDVKVEQGEFEDAARYLHDSFVLFQQLRSRWDIAYLLEGMANVMRARERAEDATKLFGAAEVLRERLGAPLPPSELPPYRRVVEMVRSALDSSVFDDAWAKGREMDVDEAVGFALSLG